MNPVCRYLAASVALVLLVAGIAGWGYAKGKAAQRRADAVVIAHKDAALVAAAESLASAATALWEVSAQTRANAAVAAQAQARVATASATATQAKHDLSAAQARWEHGFAKARQQPDCRAVLEMHLCPAVSE